MNVKPDRGNNPSLEEQVEQMWARLEQSKGRPLTQQEKNLSRQQAIDFGYIVREVWI